MLYKNWNSLVYRTKQIFTNYINQRHHLQGNATPAGCKAKCWAPWVEFMGVDSGVGVLTPWKYVWGQSMFWPSPLKMPFFHSKLLLYNCKFHSINDEQLDTITSLSMLMLTMLTSLCLISSKQTVSKQCLCCYTGLKLSWPKTKLQKVGAGDPPSKILIDGVPVEGVEEFIYLGSKQSSNGYCRPTQDWICLFSDLYRGYGIAVLSASAPKYTCNKHW